MIVGHLQTVLPFLAQGMAPANPPFAEPWVGAVVNDLGIPVQRSGLFSPSGDTRRLVVILHGMGGRPDAGYCAAAAAVFAERDVATLRLSLRGADGLGRDLHHAGFIDDLAPIFASQPFADFEEIHLLGYSLGGHVALRALHAGVDPRITRAAAVCSPLNLAAAQAGIDRTGAYLYRQAILRSLKALYPRLGRTVPGLPPADRVQRIRTIREWDRLTVVPRFGFDHVDHYYSTQSVGPMLKDMNLPALVVVSPQDPMIPADSLRGPLGRASDSVEAWWVQGGGHVYLPERQGWTERIADWLLS